MKIFFACLIILIFYSCRSSDKNSISSDPAVIAKGQNSFTQNCSGCHNLGQESIGPDLSGITEQASVEWIHNFIKDPKGAIESGDERGQQLYKKYSTMMPSFSSLPNEEIDALIAFLNTHKEGKKKFADDSTALKNPI